MELKIIFVIINLILATASLTNIPGAFLIAVSSGIYGYLTNFEVFTVENLVVFTIVGTLSLLLDNIFSILGAKKFGASKYGAIGALLGSFTIFILGPLGLILGPFLGALLGEMLFNRADSENALKAAFGAVAGLFAGIVVKTLIAYFLVGYFVYLVF
ncbi:MAG: DUF456 domain-containing protein [Patescibacteria group bacterium]